MDIFVVFTESRPSPFCYSVASVCCLSVTLCIVSKQCVVDQKLLYTLYAIGSRIWEIDWYQNEWPWPCL